MTQATEAVQVETRSDHRRCRQLQLSVRVFAFCNVCDRGVAIDPLNASAALAGFTPWPQHCGTNTILIARDVKQ